MQSMAYASGGAPQASSLADVVAEGKRQIPFLLQCIPPDVQPDRFSIKRERAAEALHDWRVALVGALRAEGREQDAHELETWISDRDAEGLTALYEHFLSLVDES